MLRLPPLSRWFCRIVRKLCVHANVLLVCCMVYLHNTDVPLIPLPRYYCFGHYPPLFYPLQRRFLENLEQEKRVKILETGQPKRLCFRISISSLLGLGGLSEMQYNRMVNGFLCTVPFMVASSFSSLSAVPMVVSSSTA